MTTREYAKAPSTLPLMLKAALPAVPLVGSLPGVKHSAQQVPDLALQRSGVVTDATHLERYREVCEFGRLDAVPATYPHMSAFALHMALMTDTSFPFAPMGLVHLRNRITQHRPVTAADVLDVEVRSADLRPHPKGRLVDVLTTVSTGGGAGPRAANSTGGDAGPRAANSTGGGAGPRAAKSTGDVVWEEVTTLFSRGAGRAEETTAAPLADAEAPQGVVHWRLGGDLGRRYGAVSGDRNPIHLHPLTAKAFGFPRNIAHGMWTKARCLAALQNKLPDAYTVDVEFKKPILLPSTVVFGHEVDGDTITFGVKAQNKNATHLVGRITKA
ncbi:MaoC family dehydratase [Aeromicrobium sp. CTD01-1L150]|uniref:MaoC family dehydratase n=1 Tax=Aeromicrobium sp. CTD01-1L150 TaxID=3341830 RepID=UPI0035C0F09E